MSKAMIEVQGSGLDLEYLLSPKAIRERSHKLYQTARSGGTHFEVKSTRLGELAQFVAAVTRDNYPNLVIPFHSRWKHFNAGGVDRLSRFYVGLRDKRADEILRIKTDLVIVSVLVDAGAGMRWKFRDVGTADPIGKSEGLAVASLRAFLAGAFSGNPANPQQVDASGLEALSW